MAFKKLVDDIILSDEETRKKLKVIFVEDYIYGPLLSKKSLRYHNNFEHVDYYNELIRRSKSESKKISP